MTGESRIAHGDATTPETEFTARADSLDPESQRKIREQVIHLAFEGDERLFDEFVHILREATPDDVDVILRGSAITGHKWGTDEPFDAKGRGSSDLDVTLVGGDMVTLFREFHIPAIHSVPLSEEHPFAAPALGTLRKRLCAIAQRPVNIQATTSLVQYVRDMIMDQPYLVLLSRSESDEPGRTTGGSDD